MTKYYYLSVNLKFPEQLEESAEVTEPFFKQLLLDCIGKLFGLVGQTVCIDVLKFDPEEKSGIIRVPSDYYIKLRSSLSLCTAFQGVPAQFVIHKASPLLLALQGDSRNFDY